MEVPNSITKWCPSFQSYFVDALKAFEEVDSFEDLKRRFLMGSGLSSNTYASYLESVKQFYHFQDGLHPLQATPSDIEAFHDELNKRVGRGTAVLRIAGLKAFYRNIAKQFPFYSSPFDVMDERLKAKLSKTKKGSQKKALTKSELRKLLEFLKKDTTLKGCQNYTVVMFLSTTGLRAFEMCSLQWRNIEFSEGVYTVSYLGKGDKPAVTELMPEVYQQVFNLFKMQFKRDPHPDDHLFFSLPNFPTKVPTPMNKPVLWKRVSAIGKAVTEAGIIKRDLQWSAHLFRRTACTLLYRECKDIKVTQGFSRHSNVDTLLKHYVDSNEPVAPIFKKILGVA